MAHSVQRKRLWCRPSGKGANFVIVLENERFVVVPDIDSPFQEALKLDIQGDLQFVYFGKPIDPDRLVEATRRAPPRPAKKASRCQRHSTSLRFPLLVIL